MAFDFNKFRVDPTQAAPQQQPAPAAPQGGMPSPQQMLRDMPPATPFDRFKTTQPVDTGDSTSDVIQTIAGAPRRLVEGTLGAGGDLPSLGGQAIAKIAQWLGMDPEKAKAISGGFGPAVSTALNPLNTVKAAQDINAGESPTLPSPLPTTADVTAATTPVFGPRYQPTTPEGHKAEVISDFASNVIQPGGFLRKSLAWGVPAALTLASENLPESWQPAAKLGAAFTGAPFTKVKNPEKIADIKTRVKAAEEFDIPLTKGQREADIPQQQREQQMIHGAKGDRPMKMFASHQEAVEAKRAAAKEGLTERMAPGSAGDTMTAAADLGFTARRYKERMKTEGGAEIDRALKEGVWIGADHLNRAPGEIRGKLAGTEPGVQDVILDSNTPIASSAMKQIDDFVKSQPKGATDVSLQGAESLRRVIGNMTAATPTDARALGKIRKYFDEWMDAAVEGGVTRVGNGQPGGRPPADVLADLKAGRTKYRAGAELERPRKGEEGGTGVAKIVGEDTNPEEINKLLAPSPKTGQMSMEAPHTLSRLIEKFGPDSDVVNNARAIVMDNLLQGGPQQTAGNIRRFLEKSPTSAERLFTPEQVATLKRYGGVSENLVPPPVGTNPSKSGYMISKALGTLTRGGAGAGIGGTVGGAIGGFLGHPTAGAGIGATLGGLVGQGVGALKNTYDASKALKPLPPGWDKIPPAQQQRWLLAQILAAQGVDRRNRSNE
jgi:hypothetical protein